MTITERIIRGLVAMGYREVKSKSRKYRTFQRDDLVLTYYVGKSGALRRGKTSSDSIVETDSYKRKIIAAGEKDLRADVRY